MRRPFIAGNWKMNTTEAEAGALASAVAEATDGAACDIAVCPPFPHLAAVREAVRGSAVAIGAQNVSWEPAGAFTGEVSLSMLKDAGASVALVGHSERRHVIGEDDLLINQKVLAALAGGFEVILCVGEKIEQRDAGKTDAINAAQLSYGLAGVSADQMTNVTIAYEPVWAIGTGKTATSQDAQTAHKTIRSHLATMFSSAVADTVRIQYGGSVKPSNAQELFGQPDIDGGLIGGASLKADGFIAIVEAAVETG